MQKHALLTEILNKSLEVHGMRFIFLGYRPMAAINDAPRKAKLDKPGGIVGKYLKKMIYCIAV